MHSDSRSNARNAAVTSAARAKRKEPKKEKETELEVGGGIGRGLINVCRESGVEKTWMAHTERESKRVNHRERSKNPKTKPDGASEHPSFIPPCNARTDTRSRTRSQPPSLFLSPTPFSSLCQFLAVVPWGYILSIP